MNERECPCADHATATRSTHRFAERRQASQRPRTRPQSAVVAEQKRRGKKLSAEISGKKVETAAAVHLTQGK
jgi:hypothetical protein